MNKSQIEASESPIPREAVATPGDVEKVLTLTPEEIEELQKEQQLKLYRSRAILSPQERRIGRGIELEQHYIQVGKPDGIAEALALQGKYKEAAETAITPERKAEYNEIAAAVDADDADCACDNFTETKEHLLYNQYIEFTGYSKKHGRDMPFIRCRICGKLNAKPTPDFLAKQLAHQDTDDDTFFKK